jgi:hypothetical protein
MMLNRLPDNLKILLTCVPSPSHQAAHQTGKSKTETLHVWFVAVATSIFLLFQFYFLLSIALAD